MKYNLLYIIIKCKEIVIRYIYFMDLILILKEVLRFALLLFTAFIDLQVLKPYLAVSGLSGLFLILFNRSALLLRFFIFFFPLKAVDQILKCIDH